MGQIRAEMAGKVIQVCVQEGDSVSEDQDLIILESMKMQIPVGSPEEGTVSKVHVAPDQFLNEGDPIVDLA
ncbi:MAG: acetyl-CoA carboxylase biotin carboxyl carrier protein subunit [Acidobacteria bacterium]|nr:acetyl-CoA carboxylase biotin carboxyl carrier protein subunit [Acidobacteriota bacterium]